MPHCWRSEDPQDYMETGCQAHGSISVCSFSKLAGAQDAQFVINELNAEQVGMMIGTGIGGIKVLEEQQTVYLNRGPDRL